MRGQKLVFIIPGFGHKPSNSAYQAIAKMLKKEGYTPVSVNIPWKESTISENTAYFIERYKRRLAEQARSQTRTKVYILGFSYGAMIAFIASTKLKVDGLILCSLSPFFKEDISKLKIKTLSPLELSRRKDFAQYSSEKLANQTKAKKVLLLYGAHESKPLIHRVSQTYEQISIDYKFLLQIGKTEHNIADRRYLNTIHHVTSSFL
jgi:esterase/lipase